MSFNITLDGKPDRSSEIDRKDDRKDDYTNQPHSRNTSTTFNRVITQLRLPPSSPHSDTVINQLQFQIFKTVAAEARSGFTKLIQKFSNLTIGSNKPLTPNTATETRNAVFLYPEVGAAFKLGDKLTLKETRAFQICLLVGLPLAVVPSKRAKVNGHFQLAASNDADVITNPEGVIQPFIHSKIGMFFTLFKENSESRKEFRDTIIQKLNLEDLQQKAIAQALLANYDFHANNALLVPKENEEFRNLSAYTSWCYHDNDWEYLDSFEDLLLHYLVKVIGDDTYVNADGFEMCMIKDNATLKKAFEIEWALESPDNEDTFETDNKFHLFGDTPCIPVRNFILGLPQSEMPLTEKHQNWLLALQNKRDFIATCCSQGSHQLWSFFEYALKEELKEFFASHEIESLDRNEALYRLPKALHRKIFAILDTKTCFKSLRPDENTTKPLAESILKNLSALEELLHQHLPDTYEDYEDELQELQIDVVSNPLTITDTFHQIFAAIYEREEFIMLTTKNRQAKDSLWKLYHKLWEDMGNYILAIDSKITKYNNFLVTHLFPLLTAAENRAFLERVRGCTEYMELIKKKKEKLSILKAGLPNLTDWNLTTRHSYRDFLIEIKKEISGNYRSYHLYNKINHKCTAIEKLLDTDKTADDAITQFEALMIEVENAFEPTLSGLYGYLFNYLTPFLDILTDIEAHYSKRDDLLTLRNELLLEVKRSSIKVNNVEPQCYNSISYRTILNEALDLKILTVDDPLYKYLDEPLRQLEARLPHQDDQEDHRVLAASSLSQ